MKLLIVCFLAVVATTAGVILCEGTAKYLFQFGFAASLIGSGVLLLTGSFK